MSIIMSESDLLMHRKRADGNLDVYYPRTKAEYVENLSFTLPLSARSYDSVAQWADILIPDEVRGMSLLEFLLDMEDSSDQLTQSEQAMLVIMEEDRFDKERQLPLDYGQVVFKLGETTPVGLCLAWIEELLADYTRGIEKLELGMMLEQGSEEIASNEAALKIIMAAEQYAGLLDYRKKPVSDQEFRGEIKRLDARIDSL